MWTDDGRQRTPDHGYTISSPCEPEGSGELISHVMRKPTFCMCAKAKAQISAIAQSLYILNLKFQASTNLIRLYSPVGVESGEP